MPDTGLYYPYASFSSTYVSPTINATTSGASESPRFPTFCPVVIEMCITAKDVHSAHVAHPDISAYDKEVEHKTFLSLKMSGVHASE